MRTENFGPLGFSCDFVLQCTEKSMYCWVMLDPDLGTVRCRFFGTSRGLAPWTSTRTLPWNCCGAPSTQMYCATTDGHCMLCLRHDTSPRPRDKSMTGGGGAPLIGLPPQKLHSHHTTVVECILHDFIIGEPTESECSRSLRSLLIMFHNMGVILTRRKLLGHSK